MEMTTKQNLPIIPNGKTSNTSENTTFQQTNNPIARKLNKILEGRIENDKVNKLIKVTFYNYIYIRKYEKNLDMGS